MQPSSLVFLVIIAIWAAYLLQHWVRRREHLATARSVDRFSDAMRVLERRTALPELDLSAPHPRSYAVSPARPSRPEVVVKRAQSPTPSVPTRPAAAVRPTRVFHVLAGVSARRVRALSLLASLLLVVIVPALAGFSVLSWWAVLVAVALLVADVAWLRHVAGSERATRRANAQALRVAGAQALRVAGAQARSASRPYDEPEPESESKPEYEYEYESDSDSDSDSVVVSPVAVAAQIAEPDPSGWAPIPVPPPTYTLKAMAERPGAIPEFVELTEYAPVHPLVPDEPAYVGQLDALVEDRRAAGA